MFGQLMTNRSAIFNLRAEEFKRKPHGEMHDFSETRVAFKGVTEEEKIIDNTPMKDSSSSFDRIDNTYKESCLLLFKELAFLLH